VSAGVILVGKNSAFGSGTITVTANSSIGSVYGKYSQVANPLHVNATKTLTIPGSTQFFGITFTGVVSGSGTISVVGGNDANTRETFGMTNSGNTFTGNLSLSGGSAIINVNSLGDAGKITLGANNVTGGFALGAGTATSLLFNTRQIVLDGSSALYNNNDSVSTTFTVNTSLGFSSAGVRTLTLGGSSTNANTFAGSIGDNGASAVSLIKESAGRWILSGTNTFSGTTTVNDGTLVLAAGTCLSDTNVLAIVTGKKVQLNTGVKEKVGVLKIGGATKADGIWGAAGNAKATYTDAVFSGAGLLYVNVELPATGTMIELF
jgi:autotransporter-associated beta strand protein